MSLTSNMKQERCYKCCDGDTASQAPTVLWLLPLWQSVVARASQTAAQGRVSVQGPVTPGRASKAILEEPKCLSHVRTYLHINAKLIHEPSHYLIGWIGLTAVKRSLIFISATCRWWPSLPNGRRPIRKRASFCVLRDQQLVQESQGQGCLCHSCQAHHRPAS